MKTTGNTRKNNSVYDYKLWSRKTRKPFYSSGINLNFVIWGHPQMTSHIWSHHRKLEFVKSYYTRWNVSTLLLSMVMRIYITCLINVTSFTDGHLCAKKGKGKAKQQLHFEKKKTKKFFFIRTYFSRPGSRSQNGLFLWQICVTGTFENFEILLFDTGIFDEQATF